MSLPVIFVDEKLICYSHNVGDVCDVLLLVDTPVVNVVCLGFALKLSQDSQHNSK
jgi:hypothetical protein